MHGTLGTMRAMEPKLGMQRIHWLAFGGLLSLALVVRLVWALKLGAHLGFGDQAEYVDGARRLLSGLPLPHQNWMFFVRAPGYSLFLAAVWAVVGHESIPAIHFVQAALSTATCAFVFALARKLRLSPVPALAACAIAVGYPYLIYYAAPLGTEGLFGFLVVAGSYCLVAGLVPERPVLWLVALGGVVLGYANLVRPNVTTMITVVAVWLLWRYRKKLGRAVVVLAAMSVPIVAVSLPWSLAVKEAGLGWMWVTDGGGVWYYMGHNDEAYELLCSSPSPERRRELMRLPSAGHFMQLPDYARALAAPPAERQREFWRAALAWDRAHVGAQPCLAVKKFYDYWRPWVSRDGYPLSVFLVSLTSAPVLAMGLWGTWLAFRRGERVASVYTAIVMLMGTVVAVTCSTEIRYRIPMVDFMLLPFTGFAVSELLSRSKKVSSPELEPAAARNA